jgi:hypothetical protein
MKRVADSVAVDTSYQNLYKPGGVAAFIAAVLVLGEVIILAIYPQPGTIRDWFTLIQSNRIIGLMDLWLLEVPMYLMFILMFLAIYVVLRKANHGLTLTALVIALLGIGIFLATNNPFSMLSLSNQYAAAATDAERSTFLAAGQALLLNTNQRAIGGFNMGLFLVSVAGLIFSSVMLKSNIFSRLTALFGILAHALSLIDYLRQALTSSSIIALLVILPNALFLVIWYFQIGLRFNHLGSPEKKMLS